MVRPSFEVIFMILFPTRKLPLGHRNGAQVKRSRNDDLMLRFFFLTDPTRAHPKGEWFPIAQRGLLLRHRRNDREGEAHPIVDDEGIKGTEYFKRGLRHRSMLKG